MEQWVPTGLDPGSVCGKLRHEILLLLWFVVPPWYRTAKCQDNSPRGNNKGKCSEGRFISIMLMYNRLMLFITKNNILHNAQRGFREGKWTETATHAFLENIQKAMEKKDKPHWNFFFFDLPKAFDILEHKILLFKFDAYGIKGLVSQWFNPSNAELNPICHLLALLGAHHILHVSRIRVKS